MSKTVDERVVEMRFDNAQFERNVKTSMSTLDKLKQKLNLTGATKGLENINNATSRVSFSTIENSLVALQKRFSTTGIIGMSVINNLTTEAMKFASKINGFVRDGIINGGTRRAMNLENAQFQLQGLLKDAEAVAAVMKNVNDAVDGTAYSLDAAASVASQLAASGMRAGDEMFSALRAVAGVAAMTNSSYEDIGRIFTQVAGQGRLMGDQLLQLSGRGMNAAATLAEYLGKTEAEVRDMTSKGSIDFKTFAAAMDSAFGEHAKKANETFNGAMSNMKSSLARIGALFVSPLIASNGPIVQFFNAMRERINEIKTNIVPFADTTTAAITKIINKATELVQKFDIQGFIDKIKSTAKSSPLYLLAKKIDVVTTPAKEAAKALQTFDEIVDKVIHGDFGNGQTRFDALTKAGYDWAHIQNLVNEKLGDSTRHATDLKEATECLSEAQAVTLTQLIDMSDAELKNIGFTEAEIEAFKELKRQSEATGIPLKDMLTNIENLNSKSLILDSFKNIGQSALKSLKAIGQAWKEIFKPLDPAILYDLIAAFHKFTTTLSVSNEDADKLRRTFKGLFAFIDLIGNVIGGGTKLAFKAFSAILNAFDLDILDVTASLGDLLVKFHDFIESKDLINRGFEMFASGVKMAADALKNLYETIIEIPKIKALLEDLKNIDLREVGKNILDGLKNGLEDGVSFIPDILVELGEKILSSIKNVLGIHSPSTKMYEIGKFTIEGLVNGLKDGTNDVYNTLSQLGSKMLDWVKGFDWSKLFAVGVSVSLVGIVKKLSDAIEAFAAPMKGLGTLLAGPGKVLASVSQLLDKSVRSINKVIKSLAKLVKAEAFKRRAEGIRNLAISIGILAASVYMLAQIDTKQMWSAVGAIGVLCVALLGLSVAVDKISSVSASFDGKSISFKGLKAGLISLGAALVLISASVKLVGSMDPEEAKQGYKGLAAMIVAIAGVFSVFGLLVKGKSAQNIDKAGSMIKKMSVALLLLVAVVKLAGMLTVPEMIKGGIFIGAFTAFVLALTGISNIAGRRIDKLGSMVLKLSVAMGLLVGVVKLAGKLSDEEMLQGAKFAAGFVVFVGALTLVTGIGKDKEIAKLGGLLLSISVSMLLMAGVIKLVSGLDTEELVKGALFATGFIVFIKALISITKIGSEEKIAKVAGTVLAMSVALGVMAGVCVLLGLIDAEALAKGVIAVGVLGTILSLMIHSLKGANDVKGSIIAMSVAIGVMAAAVAALSFVDPERLGSATLALGSLMGMFALIAQASKGLQGSMASLIVMTVAVGVLAGIVALLAQIPTENALGASASLSLLLLSLSASMLIMSGANAVMPTAYATLTVMGAALLALSGILYLIRGMDPNTAIGNAKALSLLLIALSAACGLLTLSNGVMPAAYGTLAVMTAVLAGLSVILYLIRGMDPKASIGNAVALSTLLVSMSACCAILAVAGMAGPAAINGVNALVYLMTAVSGLMIAIGGLTTLIPEVNDFLDNAIPALEKIGYGLGAFFGNVVGGFTDGITAGLPGVAQNLSDFMTNLQPFVDGAKQVDASALSGIESIVKMVALLSGAELIDSVVSAFTGVSSMDKFGAQLYNFGEAIVAFSNMVSGNVNESSVEAAANAGKLMTEMQSTIEKTGGLAQLFTGTKDMTKFGEQLITYGQSIVDFSNTVSGCVDEKSVAAAANAGKLMAEMQDAISKTDGVMQFFAGKKDMANFGDQLISFGEGIVKFSNTVSIGVDESAISSASNAGKIMLAMQDDLKAADGVIQKIVGEKDLAKFGNQLVTFGEAIVDFSDTVSGKINEEGITAASNAGKMLAELQNSIPDDKLFDGKVSISKFGKKVVNFGKYLVEYSETVTGIDIEPVDKSIAQARKLANLAKSLSDVDAKSLKPFKKITDIGDALLLYGSSVATLDTDNISKSITIANSLKTFLGDLSSIDGKGIDKFDVVTVGICLKSYINSVSGLDYQGVFQSINVAEKLVALINSMSGLSNSGVNSFRDAMSTLSSTSLNAVMTSFGNNSSKVASAGASISDSIMSGFKSKQSELVRVANIVIETVAKAIHGKGMAFKSAGENLGKNLSLGLEGQKNTISKTMAATLNQSISNIKSYYGKFSESGKYLADGFADGINNNSYKAAAKAKAMAEAASTAARKALSIHSPSKVFEKIGEYVPEGFAKGISNMISYAENSSTAMAKRTIGSTANVLSRITDIINGNIDVQPTIRPVVDLTDVQSSAGTIGSLFDGSSSIGLRANIGAISGMMSQNRQNGSSSEVVSAIDKLRKEIGGLSRPTYNVNGVTYDDGSNISEAVNDLIREIRLERRA